MVNFALFSLGSGVFAASPGLTTPFSETGFVAHKNPMPMHKATEKVRTIRISLFTFDFTSPSI
jgi:hypothetical protein